MLIQSKLIDAAKSIISSSLSGSGYSNWNLYGQFDSTDKTGITFPCIRVQCFDEEPMYKEQKAGLHKAQMEIITSAIRVVGTEAGEGTTASEFETVSDLVFNPFLKGNIETTFASASIGMDIKQILENGLETTPLTDGWIATQKLEIVCARNN